MADNPSQSDRKSTEIPMPDISRMMPWSADLPWPWLWQTLPEAPWKQRSEVDPFAKKPPPVLPWKTIHGIENSFSVTCQLKSAPGGFDIRFPSLRMCFTCFPCTCLCVYLQDLLNRRRGRGIGCAPPHDSRERISHMSFSNVGVPPITRHVLGESQTWTPVRAGPGIAMDRLLDHCLVDFDGLCWFVGNQK